MWEQCGTFKDRKESHFSLDILKDQDRPRLGLWPFGEKSEVSISEDTGRLLNLSTYHVLGWPKSLDFSIKCYGKTQMWIVQSSGS